MQSIFNITSIIGDYSNKTITITTTFTVDKTTVNKKNVEIADASSGTTVIYKLSVDDSGYGMNCTKCERIIFIQPKVGDSIELDPKKLSEFDWININGIKFKREK